MAGIRNRQCNFVTWIVERIMDLFLPSSSLLFIFFSFKLKSGWESPVLLDFKPVTNPYKHTSVVQKQMWEQAFLSLFKTRAIKRKLIFTNTIHYTKHISGGDGLMSHSIMYTTSGGELNVFIFKKVPRWVFVSVGSQNLPWVGVLVWSGPLNNMGFGLLTPHKAENLCITPPELNS